MDNSEAAIDKPDSKNSFLPATSHFTLILIEHCILVGFVLHNDFADTYGQEHTNTFCWLPFVLWLIAVLAMFVYYYFFNKARLLRHLGPQFSCCEDNPDGRCPRHSAISCTGLICCKVIDDVEISVGCSRCCNNGPSHCQGWSCWPCVWTGRKPALEPEEEQEHLGAGNPDSLEMTEVITNGRHHVGVTNGVIVDAGVDTVDEVRATSKSSNGVQRSNPDDSSAETTLLNGEGRNSKLGPTSEFEIRSGRSKVASNFNTRTYKTNGT